MTATTPRGPVLTLVGALGLALTLVLVNGASTPDASPTAPAAVTAAPDPAAAAEAPAPAQPAPPTEAPASPAPGPAAAFPDEAKFVGEADTAKGPVPVEITVGGGRAKAYVCDGKRIEVWLRGTAADGAVELTGRKSARLSGTLDGDTVEGTLRLPGYPEWTFSARATTTTRAGGGTDVPPTAS